MSLSSACHDTLPAPPPPPLPSPPLPSPPLPSPPLPSPPHPLPAREDRYSHEFVSDDDDDDGADTTDDTLQQSFANFNQMTPRFSQMIEEMQSSLSFDESDPNHQLLRRKMVNILGEEPKHQHRDSGISGVYICMCIYRICTSDCLGCAVLLCLVVCLILLASFFLPSHLMYKCACTCTCS